MKTVAYNCLGAMEGPVAGHIQRAGYPMVVYDVRDEATRSFCEGGATVVDSAAALARKSDVIITALPMPEDVEKVACGRDGIIEGIRTGSVFVDISTNPPSLIRRLKPLFRAKGALVLDAPVASGQPGAARGIHEVIVGGEQEVFERVKPILSAFGDQVLYAGPLGSGSICKLVHQMIGSSVSQAIAEGLSLGGESRGRAQGPLGMRAPRHDGQDARPSLSSTPDCVSWQVRDGNLYSQIAAQGCETGNGSRQGVERSTAGCEYRGTDSCGFGHQPWLGGQGCLHGYVSAPRRGSTSANTRRWKWT